MKFLNFFAYFRCFHVWDAIFWLPRNLFWISLLCLQMPGDSLLFLDLGGRCWCWELPRHCGVEESCPQGWCSGRWVTAPLFFCSLDCICLKIYLHVYMCKCIYIIYVYLCVHMCIIYLCVHLCMCMYMCICICMCASACGHCVHVCVKANLRCCFSSPHCHMLWRQCLSPTKNLPNRLG